jgi:hypothetical protein
MQDLASTLFAGASSSSCSRSACSLAGRASRRSDRASGADPQQNFFHRVLRTVSSPFTWIVRRITRRSSPTGTCRCHVRAAGVAYAVLFTIADTCIRHGLVAEC